jgi:G:T/U-mismatch repair DNA glycosylase
MLGPILGPSLRVLFVGINPSLRSAEVGHHFARPGNRFWPTLFAGFTPRLAGRGRQPEAIGGRPAWVLPNPSGLNAHDKPADFARLYGEAREYADTLALAAAQAVTVSGPISGDGPGSGSRPPMSSRNGG